MCRQICPYEQRHRHLSSISKTNQTKQVREHRSAHHLLTLHSFTLVKNLERISLVVEIFTQKDYRNPSLLNEVINTSLQQINISISQMRIKSQRLSCSHYEVSGIKAAVPLSAHPGKKKEVTFLSPVKKHKTTATLSAWRTNSKQTTQNLVKITKKGWISKLARKSCKQWRCTTRADWPSVAVSITHICTSASCVQQNNHECLGQKRAFPGFVLESQNPVRGWSHGLEDNFFCCVFLCVCQSFICKCSRLTQSFQQSCLSEPQPSSRIHQRKHFWQLCLLHNSCAEIWKSNSPLH